MRKLAIFGAAGAIGRVLALELERRSVPFRVVGRSRPKLEQAFDALAHAEIFPADLADPKAARAAAEGVDSIVYAVGVPYTAFELHPLLMRVTVEAAAAMGVERLLVVSSVYSYGVPQTRRVAEIHPRMPHTRKGRMRKEQEDIALEAHAKGQVAGLVLRLPDFYGPYAENSLAHLVFRAAIQGKTANWLGRIDTTHEFLYVPDAAPVIADLAARPDCFGQAWNFGGPGEIAGVDFVTRVYRAAGRAPKYRAAGPGLLKIMGWFNPLYRELPEMLYLQETPVILDDSKLSGKLGPVPKTSYDEGIRRTLAWITERPLTKT